VKWISLINNIKIVYMASNEDLNKATVPEIDDKCRMVIKALFKNKYEYISVSKILDLLEKKINKNELESILYYLTGEGTVLCKNLVIDGNEVDVPLYQLSLDYLKYLEKHIKEKRAEKQGTDIFSKEMKPILVNIHTEFNETLFENIELTDFLELFKLNTNKKIVLKKECKTLFAILISEYETHHIIKKGAFADWYNTTIGGSYNTMKKKDIKKNTDILQRIKDFHKKNPPSLIKRT